MLPFTGPGCSNCQDRRKKCDESRPACRRCTRAGIQCTGYPAPVTLGHTVSESRSKNARHLARAGPSIASSSSRVDDLAPWTAGDLALAPHIPIPEPEPYIRLDTRDILPPSIQKSPDSANPIVISPTGQSESWSDISFIGPSAATIEELAVDQIAASADFSYLQPVGGQPLTPPYEVFDLPAVDHVLSSAPAPSQGHTSKNLTSAQASLFDALFSLAHPGDEHHGPSPPSTQLPQSPDQAMLSPVSEGAGTDQDLDDNEVDPKDTEGIRNIMVRTLTLDRNVQSNAVPFVLECYSLWISRMIFQPLRVAAAGREYVLRQYARSDSARQKLMLVAQFVRTIAWSTDYDIDDLPTFADLRTSMIRGYVTASSEKGYALRMFIPGFSEEFDHSYELISASCKFLPLSAVLSIMQAAAPVFRRTCPDPPEKLVHLPSLLRHLNISLRYYATMDVLISVLTNRPMFFRYNVDFTREFPESMLHIENHLGLQWLYGVPDRLTVTLARINAIREDLGICVDRKIIKELETEIGSFRPIIATSISSDPVLTVARLVVQECWRQAAFIYLYMGLCGANTQDARVLSAHNKFMELFKGAKPARHPDMFLVLPMLILGIATRNQDDRDMIKQRLLRLADCSRPKTLGNEVVLVLDEIWTQADLLGRPATWPDLRLACLRVTGM